MSDFEPRDNALDDELGAALRRRAGRATTSYRSSTAAAHDAVVRRAGAIRRRRVAVGGGGAMAVVLLGGILLLPRGVDEQNPVVTGDVLPTFDDPSTTVATTAPTVDPFEDDDAPVTVDLSIPPVSPATTDPTPSIATPSSAATTSVATEPTATAPTATVTPPTSDTVASSSSTPTSSAPTTSESPATLAPFTDTYQSAGGSITVSWNGSALSLQSVSPASGFVSDVEDSSAARVRVRFEGADDDSRIEVRVADGQVLVDID